MRPFSRLGFFFQRFYIYETLSRWCRALFVYQICLVVTCVESVEPFCNVISTVLFYQIVRNIMQVWSHNRTIFKLLFVSHKSENFIAEKHLKLKLKLISDGKFMMKQFFFVCVQMLSYRPVSSLSLIKKITCNFPFDRGRL